MSETIEGILLHVAVRGAGDKQDDDYVAEALQAIESIIKYRVIGKDDNPRNPHVLFKQPRSELRAEQRANLSKALRGKE